MTKKHFIALADCLRKPGMIPRALDHAIMKAQMVHAGDHVNDSPIPVLSDAQTNTLRREVLRVMAEELADFCQEQNGRFNRDTFMGYINGECGPSGGRW